MNKFTPYNELKALLDNPTTLYLESIREFNPNYESLDNLELYNELRSTGRHEVSNKLNCSSKCV